MTAAADISTQPPGLTCPDRDTLQHLLSGRLGEAEADPVERHLEGCTACVALLGELSAHEGRLLKAGGSNWDEADDPQTVTALIQRLCRLPAGAAPATPNPLDTPPADEPAGRREPPAVPEQLGRYRVRRLLGAGGMGAVYLADDPELGRPVAVKVPRFAGPPEARAVAAVRHPHVCPIYDVGEQDGTPYVVMAFIEGPTLAERLKEAGRFADARAAVALVLQVAEGLAAVHDCGLVHRDLKPGNVLLDAGGSALLSDFGLARRHDDSDRLTRWGAVVGTLAYMAPEQVDAEGDFGPVTPRTDLYSLGVVLYELLTGRLPFKAESDASLLYQIVHDTPPVPRALRPDLDPALEAIILKSMARRPQDRYAEARELATALSGYLQAPASPKAARAEAPPERDRPRRLWKAAAVAVVAASLLLGAVLYLKRGDNHEGGNGTLPARPADEAKHAEQQPKPNQQPVQPPGLPAPAVSKSPRPGVAIIKEHTNRVRAVAFSPDGKLLATAGDDKSIRIWDVATGKRTERLAPGAEVYCLAFAPDGKILASGGADRAVTLWNVATWEKKRAIADAGPGKVAWLAFAPDGRRLATVGYQRKVAILWDVDLGKQVASLEGHTDDVNAAAFSPDGKTVATVSDDSTVRLWDAATGKAKAPFKAHDKSVYCLAFSPDGKKLATGGEDRTILIWDVATGKAIRPVLDAEGSVVFVGWTPDGRIVSKTYRDMVSLWQPSVNKAAVLRPKFEKPLVQVGKQYQAHIALAPDGRVLAFRDCYWKEKIHVLDLSKHLDAPK